VQQARIAFKKGSSPQDVADRLAELAVKRYTSDNVAVVVVLLGLSGQHGSSAGKGGGNGRSRGIFNVFRG
jgi:serine/threonine protein phosphatase PrpC